MRDTQILNLLLEQRQGYNEDIEAIKATQEKNRDLLEQLRDNIDYQNTLRLNKDKTNG